MIKSGKIGLLSSSIVVAVIVVAVVVVVVVATALAVMTAVAVVAADFILHQRRIAVWNVNSNLNTYEVCLFLKVTNLFILL